MMLAMRHALRLLLQFGMLGTRTGRWWFPVLVLLLAIGAMLALTAKVVVPPATYVMF
jgi:hypothetical protein